MNSFLKSGLLALAVASVCGAAQADTFNLSGHFGATGGLVADGVSVAAPVPEPATYGLMGLGLGLGLLAVGAMRRREAA